MTHYLISTATERHSPTLWPLRPIDRTLISFALEVSEEENRTLKKMVVGLSEIILEFVVSKKSPDPHFGDQVVCRAARDDIDPLSSDI